MGAKVLVFVSLLVCQLSITVNGNLTYVDTTCFYSRMEFNDSEGGAFDNNLRRFFSNITSEKTRNFYNYSVGSGSDRVYGLFQCRYDVPIEVCNTCVGDAIEKVDQECHLFGEATIWYKECMLRYANRYIFALNETTPGAFRCSTTNVTVIDFDGIIEEQMKSIIRTAASASTRFAMSETGWTKTDKLFSYAQCTPDITDDGCRNCLETALDLMINHCTSSSQVDVYCQSCQLWYNTNDPKLNDSYVTSPAPRPVEDQEPHNPPTTPPSVIKSASRPKTVIIVAGLAGAGVGLLVLSVVLCICLFRKKPVEVDKDIPSASPRILHHVESDVRSLGEKDVEQYDFATLRSATEDFSAESKLGEGGFGSVYKGTLENGEQLAIKRLSDTSRQGNKEFMAEARLLAKLQHRNLVRLIGFCSEGDEKLLVYEFLPNSSLERFLFDPEKRPHLNWVTRHKTIVGIARGLQYLHEDSRITIIHRDLKPENILLDNEMNPKIADFGLARLFEQTQKFGSTIRIAGTRGYMAPECLLGEYSSKSDVYSFGVMLLEIVLGQTNRIFNQKSTEEDLPMHAWLLWNDERSIELVDPELDKSYSNKDIERCIQIGLLCVQPDAEQRPTMTEVVLMLTVGSIDLPLPSPPEMTFRQFKLRGIRTGEQRSDSEPFSTKSITDDLHPKPR
ncbi:cysteine-rich receptor-like protein kinase 10 [Silene latifolia]|uniref:cysteine-rich receptor-like protein kinase 10 n=1 Tax=Silene latifolia TaxID=37657 RepID=UPI003D7829BD